MEEAEEAEEVLPGAVMLKDRHGTTLVKCVVFSWVCDLIQVRFPVLLSICVHSMIVSTLWQARIPVQTTMYLCKPSRILRTLSTCTVMILQTTSNLPSLDSRPAQWLPSKSYLNTHPPSITFP